MAQYPSVSVKKNITNAEGAIPFSGEKPPTAAPQKFFNEMNPNPAGVCDCQEPNAPGAPDKSFNREGAPAAKPASGSPLDAPRA